LRKDGRHFYSGNEAVFYLEENMAGSDVALTTKDFKQIADRTAELGVVDKRYGAGTMAVINHLGPSA
jgi:hypothetical protein